MTNPLLPDDDHVSRYCRPSTVEYGIPTTAAFLPRSGEEYLSVNWLEYFGEPTLVTAVERIRAVFSEKGYRVSRNGRFAVLNIGDAKTAVEEATGRAVNFDYLPLDDDPSHAGIRGYTADDLAIAVELAALLIPQNVHSVIA